MVMQPTPAHAALPSPPSPRAGAPRSSRVIVVVLVLAVVSAFAIVGAFMIYAVSMNPFDSAPYAIEPAEALAFAGFGATDGLEIRSPTASSWLDTIVEFELVGTPADIDRALELAHFAKPFKPGVSAQHSGKPEVVSLRGVRSAQDDWDDPQVKHRVARVLSRGSTSSGPDLEVVHVTAFTT